jgi:hypothetical protein
MRAVGGEYMNLSGPINILCEEGLNDEALYSFKHKMLC